MSKTNIFVLGLVGSIFGLLASFVWIFFGTSFIAAFISGVIETQKQAYTPISNGMVGFGLLISLFQSSITTASFIISLVKTTPASLNKDVKDSGVWVLVLGIITIIINPFNFIASILLIIGGSLAIQKAKQNNAGFNNLESETAATSVSDTETY